MKGITWYKHPTTGELGNLFYLYFGRRDSGELLPLRLHMQYYGDSWLFVQHAWGKADGVELKNLPQRRKRVMGWERDNASGDVWEWSDEAVTASGELHDIKRVIDAKMVTIRFEGRQYYHDFKLTPNHIKAAREVLTAYEAVGGRLP